MERILYIPSHFSETDSKRITEFVSQHPLATMVGSIDGQLIANHLPFMCSDLELKPGSQLISHTAKANPIWKLGETNASVLLIFAGYETYISPSYYPTKQETHKVVPTYKYVAIHIHGKLSCFHDENKKLQIVETLTNEMESSKEKPWAVADAPDDYIQMMLANIVGISLEVERIEAKWKVSQNRPERDQQGVIDALQKNSHDPNDHAMATEIANRKRS